MRHARQHLPQVLIAVQNFQTHFLHGLAQIPQFISGRPVHWSLEVALADGLCRVDQAMNRPGQSAGENQTDHYGQHHAHPSKNQHRTLKCSNRLDKSGPNIHANRCHNFFSGIHRRVTGLIINTRFVPKQNRMRRLPSPDIGQFLPIYPQPRIFPPNRHVGRRIQQALSLIVKHVNPPGADQISIPDQLCS